MEVRTRILELKERKDGYTEMTIILDRNREKRAFKRFVDLYRDDKTLVFELKKNDG